MKTILCEIHAGAPITINPISEHDIIVWIVVFSLVASVFVSLGKFLVKAYPLVNRLSRMLDDWPIVDRKLDKIEERLSKLEQRNERKDNEQSGQ